MSSMMDSAEETAGSTRSSRPVLFFQGMSLPGDGSSYVVAMLGRGGSADVALCVQNDMTPFVAKFFLPGKKNEEATKEEKNVNEMLRKLKIPELLLTYSQKVKKMTCEGGQTAFYLTYDTLGVSLSLVLDNNRAGLPVSLVKHFLRQLLAGLRRMHELGWRHLDVKPDNLLLTLTTVEAQRMVMQAVQSKAFTINVSPLITPKVPLPLIFKSKKDLSKPRKVVKNQDYRMMKKKQRLTDSVGQLQMIAAAIQAKFLGLEVAGSQQAGGTSQSSTLDSASVPQVSVLLATPLPEEGGPAEACAGPLASGGVKGRGGEVPGTTWIRTPLPLGGHTFCSSEQSMQVKEEGGSSQTVSSLAPLQNLPPRQPPQLPTWIRTPFPETGRTMQELSSLPDRPLHAKSRIMWSFKQGEACDGPLASGGVKGRGGEVPGTTWIRTPLPLGSNTFSSTEQSMQDISEPGPSTSGGGEERGGEVPGMTWMRTPLPQGQHTWDLRSPQQSMQVSTNLSTLARNVADIRLSQGHSETLWELPGHPDNLMKMSGQSQTVWDLTTLPNLVKMSGQPETLWELPTLPANLLKLPGQTYSVGEQVESQTSANPGQEEVPKVDQVNQAPKRRPRRKLIKRDFGPQPEADPGAAAGKRKKSAAEQEEEEKAEELPQEQEGGEGQEAELTWGLGRLSLEEERQAVLPEGVSPELSLKLTDFGISRSIALGGKKQVLRGGTPSYMAPELLASSLHFYDEMPPVDLAKIDSWAVYVTTYELATALIPHTPPEDYTPLRQLQEIAKDRGDLPAEILRTISFAGCRVREGGPPRLLPDLPRRLLTLGWGQRDCSLMMDFLGKAGALDPDSRATIEDLAKHAFLA